MKKLALLVLVALFAGAAVCVYRAETFFVDAQAEPARLPPLPPLDEAGAAQRLAGAIRFPTVTHDDPALFATEAFDGLHAWLETTFPRVHRQMKRRLIGHNLVYELAGRNADLPPVLFTGHQDVVPVDASTLSQWTHPPFAGVIADGQVWGRGSLDDKFSVIGLLEAMESLLANGFAPERTLVFAFGQDEEGGGNAGAAAVAADFASRGRRFEFVLDEGGVVMTGAIAGIERPVAFIGVSEKGYLNLHLVVDDPGGHSSEPPRHTAAGILAKAIVAVERHPFPARLDSLFLTMDVIGAYLPFTDRLALANTWLLGPVVKHAMLNDPPLAPAVHTTTAVTMLSGSSKSNILPTRAEAVVNFRLLPGDTIDAVRRYIEDVIDDPRVRVVPGIAIEASVVSPTDTAGYALLAGTVRAMDEDILVAPYMVRGGTDARKYHLVSDNVYRFYMARFTPELLKLTHGIDEHVSIDNYLEGVRFFAYMLQQAGQAEF